MQGRSLRGQCCSSLSGRSYHRGCVAYCILLCLFIFKMGELGCLVDMLGFYLVVGLCLPYLPNLIILLLRKKTQVYLLSVFLARILVPIPLSDF